MDADHVKIGTVVSKHGYKGSIKVKLLSTELKRIPEVDFIFIDIDECFIPYKVVSLKTLNDNSAIFKLRELNSEGEVAEVILKDVYVNKKYSKMLPQESFFFNELIATTIADPTKPKPITLKVLLKSDILFTK